MATEEAILLVLVEKVDDTTSLYTFKNTVKE